MTKNELKNELKRLVARKMELTRERVAYKRSLVVGSKTSEQIGNLLGMWSDCSDQKALIRSTQLAYAFLLGRTYKQQEPSVRERNEPPLHTVARLCGRSLEELTAWAEGEVAVEAEAAA